MDTHKLLVQVYAQDAVSRNCVFNQFAHFRAVKESVEDEPRWGSPSISTTPENIERVRVLLAKDWLLKWILVKTQWEPSCMMIWVNAIFDHHLCRTS